MSNEVKTGAIIACVIFGIFFIGAVIATVIGITKGFKGAKSIGNKVKEMAKYMEDKAKTEQNGKYCQYCGSELGEDETSCPNCGAEKGKK